MLGYFGDQAATEDAFNAHGWFMTGDLGWVDEAGYLRVTGRSKDVIDLPTYKGGALLYFPTVAAPIDMLTSPTTPIANAAFASWSTCHPLVTSERWPSRT